MKPRGSNYIVDPQNLTRQSHSKCEQARADLKLYYVILSPKSDLICFVGNIKSDLMSALIRCRNCCFLRCAVGVEYWGFHEVLSLALFELFCLGVAVDVRWVAGFTLC